MSNIKEFCFTLDNKTSKDTKSAALLIDNRDEFQQPYFADLDIYDNLLGGVPLSNHIPPESVNTAKEFIDKHGTAPDVEHSVKAFCIPRVQCTNPLQDFSTISETTKDVLRPTITPESHNSWSVVNSVDADNISQTQTEVSWASSESEHCNKILHACISHEHTSDKMLHCTVPQIKVVRDKRLFKVIPKPLKEYARCLWVRLGLPANKNIQYVNNGNGIVNPNYRTPRTEKDQSPTCSACNKTFQRTSQFIRHMSQHTNDKRYLCVICGKGFHDLFDLKRHTRTHTGVRPYHCTQCGYSFTQLNSLEKHKSTKHWLPILYGYKERRSKLYICEQCGESTNNAELLECHVKHCSTMPLNK